jgi:hypothetical protein
MIIIRDSKKKHILNIINELKNIENKQEQLSNFYITNKENINDYLLGYKFYEIFFNNYNEFFTNNIDEHYQKYFNNCNVIYNYITCNFNNLNESFLKTLENETNNLFIQIRNDYEYNLLEQKYILKKKLIHYENIKQKKRMFLLNLIIVIIFVFTVFCTTIIFNNFNDTNKMHLMHNIHNNKQCILHTQLYNKHEKLKNII